MQAVIKGLIYDTGKQVVLAYGPLSRRGDGRRMLYQTSKGNFFETRQYGGCVERGRQAPTRYRAEKAQDLFYSLTYREADPGGSVAGHNSGVSVT